VNIDDDILIVQLQAEIEELKIVAGVRLAGMTALQAEIERLNAHLTTVQKQADDIVAKHSVLTDNVIAANAVINDNSRARQRLESVIDEYKAEVVFLRGQLAGKWVSVAEGLPNFDESVLVLADEYMSICTFFFDGSFSDDYQQQIECVTHWQPLPAPPEA